MTVRRLILSVGIGVLLWSGPHLLAASGDPPKYAGRSLAAALEELRSRGVNSVYSTDLVSPDLIIQSDPPAIFPRQILDQLLTAFGLASVDGPGGTVLIVRAPPPAPANGAIVGQVRMAGSGQPLPDAAIRILRTPHRAVSGAEGRFRIEAVPPGRYVLEARAPGLVPRRFDGIQVDAGGLTETTLEIEIVPLFQEVVKVDSGAEVPGGDTTAPHTVLGPEALQQRSRLGDDVSRAIAGTPGIAAGDKSAALLIRGGDPGEAAVIFDGLELEEPLHLRDFLGFSSIIDSRALDRTEVLGGGFGADYGDHLSGVIDLHSSEPPKGTQGLFSTSLIGTGLLAGGAFPGDAGGWMVSARSWYPDAVLDIVDPGGEDISPRYHDLMAKAELPLGDEAVLTGHLLATRDNVDFVDDFGEVDVTADGSTEYLWLDLKAPWTERLYSRSLLSRGKIGRRKGGDLTLIDGGLASVSDQRSFTSLHLAQDWIFQASERSSLKFGLVLRRVAAEYEYTSHSEGTGSMTGPGIGTPVDRQTALQPSGTTTGAYLSDRFRLSPAATLEAGVRYDRQELTAEHQVSPRLNLLVSPAPTTAWRFAWGLYSQSQTAYQLAVEDGDTGFYPAERAEHRIIGFDHRFPGGHGLSLTAYDKEISRVRPRYENLFNPLQMFPEVQPDRVRIAPDRGRARGLEALLTGPPGRSLTWSAGYTLARVEDSIDGEWVPRSWDQTHALNLALNYRIGAEWDFSFSGTLHSGWPTTPLEARSVEGPDGSPVIEPIVGERNSIRFPLYHRVDARASRHIPVGRGALTLFLEVTNLYGRDNACCVQEFDYHPRPDGTVEVESVEGYWLQRLPVFGMTWAFGP